MTLLLTHEDVRSVVDMSDAIDAMEEAFREEGEGAARLPQRINMQTGRGWLRVGPVALEKSGWMGFKAMNLAPGLGVRYQVHLYDLKSGALACIMDGQHLTTLRTGATSAVATRRLARPGPGIVGLLGSGVEARAQLEGMRVAGFVGTARVFSPTESNRLQLAQDFRAHHAMDIQAVGAAEEAVEGADIIVAAVKSSTPVFLGRWLRPGVHVNSVGTARRDQREIDLETFTRCERIVVDSREGVFEEAGDAVDAREKIDSRTVDELATLVIGKAPGRTNDAQITLFKSVGTGIQDIGLAALIYRRATERAVGRELGEFPYLKKSNGARS